MQTKDIAMSKIQLKCLSTFHRHFRESVKIRLFNS